MPGIYSEEKKNIEEITMSPTGEIDVLLGKPVIDLSLKVKLFEYDPFGAYYNYSAAFRLSPPGWHLPTLVDWDDIIEEHSNGYSGANNMACRGDMFWADDWGTDEQGMSMMGSGYVETGGSYASRGLEVDFWAAFTNPLQAAEAYEYYISNDDTSVHEGMFSKKFGLSVRFVKNDGNIGSGMIRDLEGNEYRTVKIGQKVWTKSNWRCTRDRTGQLIERPQFFYDWYNKSYLFPQMTFWNEMISNA